MQESPQNPKKDFNYCAVAKTLAAIPALPIIAVIAASLFDTYITQIASAFFAVLGAIYLAIWIDRIPFLMRKVCPLKGKSSGNGHPPE